MKSKLRSGTCELEEEMDRGKLAREERLCRVCGVEVGSVSHFVVTCGPLERYRMRWWKDLVRKLKKEDGGKSVAVSLQEWKKEGRHELVTILLLGGGEEMDIGIRRILDRETRKGLWSMMKERRRILEEK